MTRRSMDIFQKYFTWSIKWDAWWAYHTST